MKYKIALQESEEGFSVSVPGLPGCWSQGATEEEAVESIQDAIRETSPLSTIFSRVSKSEKSRSQSESCLESPESITFVRSPLSRGKFSDRAPRQAHRHVRRNSDRHQTEAQPGQRSWFRRRRCSCRCGPGRGSCGWRCWRRYSSNSASHRCFCCSSCVLGRDGATSCVRVGLVELRALRRLPVKPRRRLTWPLEPTATASPFS